MALICSTFPAYTVEDVEQIEDLNPVMGALRALGIYNGLLYGKDTDRAHTEALWADWEQKHGRKRPEQGMMKTGDG